MLDQIRPHGLVKFDYLLRSASASAGRVELLELLRSIVCKDLDRR